MEGEVLKYGWLIVLTLGQIIYIGLRVLRDRNHKKVSKENPSHGERLATLEKGQKIIEERLDKIEAKLS